MSENHQTNNSTTRVATSGDETVSDLKQALDQLGAPHTFSFTSTARNPFQKSAAHSSIANKLSAVYLTLADIEQKWFAIRFKREFRQYPLSIIAAPVLCSEYMALRTKTCTGCIMKGDMCWAMDYATMYKRDPTQIKVELIAQRDEDGVPILVTNPSEELITEVSMLIQSQLSVARSVLTSPEILRHAENMPVWYSDYVKLKRSLERMESIYRQLCRAEMENEI